MLARNLNRRFDDQQTLNQRAQPTV